MPLTIAVPMVQVRHIRQQGMEGMTAMGASKRGSDTIKEFQEFIAFLQGLWGVLTGISVFFPLSNTLTKVIPLGNFYDEPPGSGAFSYFSPQLVTIASTLITLFVILATFGRRNEYRRTAGQLLKRRAWLSFCVGFLFLLIYLLLNYGIYDLFYGPLEIWGGDPRRLIGDVLLLLTYSIFFALITRAFVLLGMIEFYADSDQPDGSTL